MGWDWGWKAKAGSLGTFLLWGLLGGAMTKGSSGSFNTEQHLDKLSELDPDLPIHMISGNHTHHS